MAQTPQQRRAAQRRTARQLQRGERPLGGEYQKRVVSSLRRQAHENIRNQLGHYLKYDDNTVRRSVYEQMNIDAVVWSITAGAEEIRSRAGDKGYIGIFESERNPWWYHPE